jgi:hypothetical protein
LGSQKYRKNVLEILLSYLACSQIWLNLHIDYCHFGYNTKLPTKKRKKKKTPANCNHHHLLLHHQQQQQQHHHHDLHWQSSLMMMMMMRVLGIHGVSGNN